MTMKEAMRLALRLAAESEVDFDEFRVISPNPATAMAGLYVEARRRDDVRGAVFGADFVVSPLVLERAADPVGIITSEMRKMLAELGKKEGKGRS